MDFKFTVLMAVYAKEKPEFLDESIKSILSNTVLPNEIIIVKDGKLTTELEDILAKYSNNAIFKIVGYDTNKGLGMALNYGVLLCSNEIIARMDSDDICAPDRFFKQLDYLNRHKDITLLGSNTNEFIGSIVNVVSHRYMPETNETIREYSKTRNPFIHPSIMTYRKAILEVGNYQDCYLCEDYDLWARMLVKGFKAYNIQEPLVYMRVSPDFYKRRGGLKYCRVVINFKKKLYKTGFMSRGQYIKTKLATLFFTLLPSFIRGFLYRKFLRR